MMKRLLSLVFIVALMSLLIVMTIQASSRPVKNVDPRVARTTVYALPESVDDGSGQAFSSGMAKGTPTASLGALQPSASPGLQIYQSYRDMQENSTMGRKVDWRGEPSMHFTVMSQPSLDVNIGRTIWYAVYDPISGAWPTTLGIGCKLQGTGEKGGFSNIDVDNNGLPTISGHRSIPETANPKTVVFYEQGGLGGCFYGSGSEIADTMAERISLGSSTQLIWPKIEYQINGATHVTHMAAYQSGAALDWGAIAYYRKVGVGTAGTWTGFYVDSAMNGVTVTLASSRVSQKFAIVWTMNTAQGLTEGPNQIDNDVFYRMSSDMGATLGAKVNVTNYAPNVDGFRAYAEVCALFASDDKLHLVWPARVWPGNAYDPDGTIGFDCRIQHWSENFTSVLSTVAAAEWDQINCRGGSWQLQMAKVTFGECGGKFYTIWTQFNNIPAGVDDDCASSGADATSSANGDIWLSVSSDLNGLTWDQARNLTNSYTPDCDTVGGNGPCDSDGWATISRFGMDLDSLEAVHGTLGWPTAAKTAVFPSYTGKKFLHLQYINDKFPGSLAVPEGIATINPVKWIMMPCVDPVPNPILAIRPSGITYPEFIKHGAQLPITVTMENVGNTSLTVSSITKVQTSPASPNAVNISTTGPVTIPAGIGNTSTMTITLNPGGVINSPGTSVLLKGIVYFKSNSPAPFDSLAYTFDLLVADTVVIPMWDTLSTGCTRLTVGSNGNMGEAGTGEVNMDYWDFGDCDTVDSIPGATEVYVFDGSPIVITKVASPDTVIASWSIFGDYIGTPNGFRPVVDKIAPIVTHAHTNAATYQQFVSGQFVTVDSSIAVEKTWWAPTATDSCNFIIQKMMVFPYKGTAQSGLVLGEAFDFDVPGDTASYNTGGFEATQNLVYQKGYEYQSVAGKECQKNDRRFAGTAMLGYYKQNEIAGTPCINHTDMYGGYTALNSDYVYPAGSFVPRELWTNMGNPGLAAAPDNADQHTVLTYKYNYSLAATDTFVVYSAIATIKNGTLADLQSSISKAQKWYKGNLRGVACLSCCIGTTGNVDGDPGDVCDISDLSAMVDYLFFGGAISTCFEENDVNQDVAVDISDLQSLIDFLFFGATVPNC